jgi:hypothetical protein
MEVRAEVRQTGRALWDQAVSRRREEKLYGLTTLTHFSRNVFK